MGKQQQIEQVRSEFARLMDAISSVDEHAMTTPAGGHWGVREVLAHIAGWTLIDTTIMQRLARGETPLPEGVAYGTGDERNAGFATGAEMKSAEGVVDDLRTVFEAFVAAAESLTEERFAKGRTANRIMEETAIPHLREHRIEIEAYRGSLSLT